MITPRSVLEPQRQFDIDNIGRCYVEGARVYDWNQELI